jgi:hypothetical protein
MIAALRLVGAVLVACMATAGEGRAEPNATRGTAAVIVEWNLMANEIAFAEDQFLTFKGARAYSLMHIARHDALNAIHPAFEQFAYHARKRKAHPIAAAAQAAREVLVAEYPARRTDVDTLLAENLRGVPDGPAKTAGIELGRRSAATILDARRGDGYDFQGEYSFKEGPGEYQTTPPFAGFVLQPGFRFASRSRSSRRALSGRRGHRRWAAAPPNMPTRTFRSLSAAADECADSRVMLGFHFRYATDAGKELGRRVARYLVEHHLRARER